MTNVNEQKHEKGKYITVIPQFNETENLRGTMADTLEANKDSILHFITSKCSSFVFNLVKMPLEYTVCLVISSLHGESNFNKIANIISKDFQAGELVEFKAEQPSEHATQKALSYDPSILFEKLSRKVSMVLNDKQTLNELKNEAQIHKRRKTTWTGYFFKHSSSTSQNLADNIIKMELPSQKNKLHDIILNYMLDSRNFSKLFNLRLYHFFSMQISPSHHLSPYLQS